jgi:thymidylate synthase
VINKKFVNRGIFINLFLNIIYLVVQLKMLHKNQVDWTEPELVKWLGNTTRKGTRSVYRNAFGMYVQFTGMTAEQLIDEAIEDFKKDVRQRRAIVKTRLLNFYHWLKEEYPRKSRGKGKHKILGKGVSCAVEN